MDKEYNLTIEKAFEYFISQHGGAMRQMFASYLRADINMTLERFLMGYLDKCQSNVAIYLMNNDKNFMSKLVDYLKK